MYRELYDEECERAIALSSRFGELAGYMARIAHGTGPDAAVARKALHNVGAMCPECDSLIVGGKCPRCNQRGQ